MRIPGDNHTAGLAVIAVYGPISSARQRDRDDFLDQIRRAKRGVGSRDILIVGGDFNADFDTQREALTRPRVVGRWGGDRTNRSGADLLDFCDQEALSVTDTMFYQPMRKRHTWWHPARGTGHTIDHFLTKQSQRRFVDSVRTVHQGRRGNAGDPLHRVRWGRQHHWGSSDFWDDYTDHLPIEICVHFWPQWNRTRQNTTHRHVQMPNLQAIVLPGPEAQQKRDEWHQKLDQQIVAMGGDQRQLTWHEIAITCAETSLQVFGPVPKEQNQPHLLGHEQENRQLDRDVANALAHRRSFRGDALPRTPVRQQEYDTAVRQARAVAQTRKRTRRRWKWEWVDRVTEAVSQAHVDGNTRQVFALNKELGIRDERLKQRVVSSNRPVMDPEAEREAWKEHFRKIQEHREVANGRVWQNVAPSMGVAHWLATRKSRNAVAV